MNTEYTADELLPLSGIQHFSFCRRQWALIHVERQWQENGLTAEGRLMHQRVDNPFDTEVRGGIITARSLPVASYRLGLYGVCDVVECTPSADGVHMHGHTGTYLPCPVEYKRGGPKDKDCDRVQLCAQAMCLEEMFSVSLEEGALYYGETRRREVVSFSGELRELVEKMAAEMHQYYSRGYTPRVRTSKACRSCSLTDVCLPRLQTKTGPASAYIEKELAKIGENE